MKKKKPDFFSEFLFNTGQNPNRAEIPQKNPEDPNTLIDKEGNVYDLKGNLIRERLDKITQQAWEFVKKNYPEYPEIKPSDPLVQFYKRRFLAKKQSPKRKKRK